MDDRTIIKFGEHQGTELGKVPASYLIYLWENKICFGELKEYIRDNLDVLYKELKDGI